MKLNNVIGRIFVVIKYHTRDEWNDYDKDLVGVGLNLPSNGGEVAVQMGGGKEEEMKKQVKENKRGVTCCREYLSYTYVVELYI